MQGVERAAAAAKAQGAEHFVLVSSMLVTPKNRWHPIRLLLNNIRWSLMDEKFAGELQQSKGAAWSPICAHLWSCRIIHGLVSFPGEEALRRIGCSYTIVRPAGLKNAQPRMDELVAGALEVGHAHVCAGSEGGSLVFYGAAQWPRED